MDIEPTPPTDGRNDCQCSFDLGRDIDVLRREGIGRQLIESLDFGRSGRWKQRGLKRARPDPPHEPDRGGGKIPAASVDVRAEHCDEVVGRALRGEQVGGGELGVVGDRVRPADLELDLSADTGGGVREDDIDTGVVPE